MDELAGNVADRCGTFMYGFRDDLVDSLSQQKLTLLNLKLLELLLIKTTSEIVNIFRQTIQANS